MQMELSKLYGLGVYTDTGIYVGKVKDVAIDIKEKRISGLAVENPRQNVFDVDSAGVIIPHRWILAINDIIIIKHVKRWKKEKEKEREKERKEI